MSVLIVCDLCQQSFDGIATFTSHYVDCTGPAITNAYNLLRPAPAKCTVKLESKPNLQSSLCEVPKNINYRGTVTNVKSHDVYSFKWTVLAAIEYANATLLKEKYPKGYIGSLMETSTYKIYDISSQLITYKGITLNFRNIQFPMDLQSIDTFESNNPQFCIHVYGLEKQPNGKSKVIGPIRRSPKLKMHIVYMLAIYNTSTHMYHYTLVRDMKRLMKSQYTKSHVSGGTFCDYCLRYYNKSHFRHYLKDCVKRI